MRVIFFTKLAMLLACSKYKYNSSTYLLIHVTGNTVTVNVDTNNNLMIEGFQNKLFANTAVLKINQTDVDSIRKQLPIQNSTRLSTANVVSIKLLTVID